MELIRAKLLLDGYNSSGQFAHEAEVSFMRNLGFSESDVLFMNQLRYFINGIKYYGEDATENKAQEAIKTAEEMTKKFLEKKPKLKQQNI